MSDFKRHSNFRENMSASSVVFGANKPVLEVELNELQQIVDTKLSRVIKTLGGSSIVTASGKNIEDCISYGSEVTIAFGSDENYEVVESKVYLSCDNDYPNEYIKRGPVSIISTEGSGGYYEYTAKLGGIILEGGLFYTKPNNRYEGVEVYLLKKEEEGNFMNSSYKIISFSEIKDGDSYLICADTGNNSEYAILYPTDSYGSDAAHSGIYTGGNFVRLHTGINVNLEDCEYTFENTNTYDSEGNPLYIISSVINDNSSYMFSELSVDGINVPLTIDGNLNENISIENEVPENWGVVGHNKVSIHTTTKEDSMQESLVNLFKVPVTVKNNSDILIKLEGKTKKCSENAGLYFYIDNENYLSIQRKCQKGDDGSEFEVIGISYKHDGITEEYSVQDEAQEILKSDTIYLGLRITQKDDGSLIIHVYAIEDKETMIYDVLRLFSTDFSTESLGRLVLSNLYVVEESGLTAYIDSANVKLPYNEPEVYIHLTESIVTGNSKLKSFGNTNGDEVENTMIDTRLGIETTRRKIVNYTLCTGLSVPENTETDKYVHVGTYDPVTKVFSPALNSKFDLIANDLDYIYNSMTNLDDKILNLEKQMNGWTLALVDELPAEEDRVEGYIYLCIT